MADGFPESQYGLTSPTAVCGDVVVAGSLVSDGNPQGPSGDVRGFDARTGKVLWRFHTVPRPGEPGSETWEAGSWKERGGLNAWSFMTVDEARSLVFLPLTSPSYDFYGGDRKGANLYGDSVVALDCKTGKMRWHYQIVHHDLWDYDLPAAPVLADGEARRKNDSRRGTGYQDRASCSCSIARPASHSIRWKSGQCRRALFLARRASPRSPIPLKPPPLARQSMTAAELTNVTPESRAECLALTEGAKLDVKIYDPLGEQDQALFPGLNGGANYGGASFDPGQGLLFVNTMDVGGLFRMVKRRDGAAIPYALRAKKYEFFTDANGYPCQRPPWGSLFAVDLDTGDIRWRATFGEFDELKQRGIPKTGTPNIGGSIVTDGGLRFHRGHQRPQVPRLRSRHRRGACGRRPCLRAASPLPRPTWGRSRPAVRGDRGGRRQQVRQGLHGQDRGISRCPSARPRQSEVGSAAQKPDARGHGGKRAFR